MQEKSGSNEEGSLSVTKDNNHDSSSNMQNSDNISSNITDIASASTSTFIRGQATGDKIGDEQKKENESDLGDFSDLDSIFDTPIKSKMRRNLRRRIQLQQKQTEDPILKTKKPAT